MEEEINITEVIMNSINTIFQNVFSSIDNGLYSALDDITFINEGIFDTSYFRDLFGTSSTNGILLIANSLVFGFLLYYACKLLLSHLLVTQVERPTSFIFKLIVFGIFMNCSMFVCEQIVSFVSILSSSIQSLGKNFFSASLTFSSLIESLNLIIKVEENSFSIFSIDGLLKGVISISFINLGFSYAIRYIMIKVFILISPFAFLSLCTSSTSSFFRAWLKCFLSLLLVQVLVVIILLILFSVDFSSGSLLSKLLICGSIFTLIKANSYVREIIGGVSTDFNAGISGLRSLMR